MKHTFNTRKAEAQAVGLYLERDTHRGHPYCLWFNSPTGSKEIFIRNLREEFEEAFQELIQMKRMGA